MREKKRCRWLALLLAVVMVLSVLPTAVFAEEESSADAFYKIVHVDCGRKYFSPENIKKIIDNAAAAGFNQVELYLSDNQGFRFALDDMNVTTSTGNTYDLTPALGDGYSDGSKYPDGSGKYLTQSEMTDIISYAAGKGIDIVPCVNVPGHMGAILEVFTSFRYTNGGQTSQSSIDLGNDEAVAFALAITQKYVDYFKTQGVKFYNIGADEYANDLSSMGFEGMGTELYTKFVQFLNSAAGIIIDAGMTPRAFNDGFLYKDYNISVTPNKAYEICYWTSGWGDYDVAAAQTLNDAGYKLINTHGDYYWVLGNTGWQCSAEKASGFNYTSFQGGTISDPAGAMFCIWCDVGNADGTDDGTAVVGATADVIAAFGAVLPASESGGSEGGETEPTDPTDPGEGTENKTITVTVGRTATDTISGYNFAGTYTTEDPSIATVEVTGTDAVEATTTYTQASVTCNDLISIDSKNWTAASGYFYKAADGNYYPVYAKRSSATKGNLWQYTEYTYTWGYKVDDSNPTQIGNTQTEGSRLNDGRYETPDITVYTQSATEAVPASTTITFTGVYPGTTHVTVGSTEYEINVAYKTENVSVVVDGSKTVSQPSTIKGDAVVDDPSVVSVSTSGKNVTFSGQKVGTTTVTVGDTIYTVTVSEEDLSQVTPLTVEYWITNRQVTANGATSMTIAASASGVYSESGALFSSLVPATGTQGSNTMVFWKGTRLASGNWQTSDSGVDKTTSGTDFTYVRYWDGSWAYSADGKEWTNVESGDQIVAYYLQKTEVTDEITTEVVDWGVIPSTSYNSTNFVLLDFAVKYESGEQTPSSFPVSGKTMAFHCDPSDRSTVHQYNGGSSNTWSNNYRDLGMIKAEETADYEVYMITFTPTNDSNTTQVAGNASNATSYTYDGTEKVVWVDDEANLGDFADENLHYTSISGNYTYSVGGTPIIPGIEIFNRHGMLVTYYVRAKVTEDSLSVHYIDQTTNQEFYSYNIAVQSGTAFNENIGLADPWKGNLKNGSVTNLQGNTQTVSADLSTMPAIGAQYRYSDYTCKNVETKNGNKEVYLYYTFTNSHTFVIDFGLPLKITTTDLGISGDWTSATVTGEKYGTAEATVGEGVSYTPTKVLPGVETLQLTLTGSTGSVTHQIYIYPASNVLYEDDFLKVATNIGSDYKAWTEPTDSATGAPQSAAQDTLYGYDVAYEASTQNSMNSAWTITGLSTGNGSQYLTTTFTGNGFDLIGTAGPNTGYVYLILQGTENKLIVIDTSYVDGDKTLYQVPLAHEMLKDGNYTAYIRAAFRQGTAAAGSGDTGTQMSRAAAFSMSAAPTALDSVYDMVDAIFADGFEIDDVEYVYFDDASALAELENSSRATYAMSYALNSASAAATADAGVNATERPDGTTVTIDGFRVYRGTNEAYIESERGREYVNVLDKVQGEFAAYVEGGADGTKYTKANYESQGGPQNEIYLSAGNAVTFQTNLTIGDTVQVSARAVSDTAYLNDRPEVITSNTEMYYEVTVGEGGVITIANGTNATGMLAIANLKVPAETTFKTPTEQTLVTAFAMMRSYSAAPGEPDPEQPGTEEPAPKPVFTPETFKTKVSSLRTRSRKVVTLTITASTDVDHVVVNGKTYYPVNKLLVRLGWSKTCVFTIVDTAGASETRNFEIVAYNADGLASITYTDAG